MMAREHFLATPRQGRYHELGSPGEVEELWLVLHGYGMLAGRFLRWFEPVAREGRRIVAPEGLSRFYLDDRYERVGASWMTREQRGRDIGDTHRWLDAVLEEQRGRGAAAARVVLLGFSQGGPVAARWCLLGHAPVDQLVVWGEGLPRELDLAPHRERLAELGLWLCLGDDDPYLPAARIAAEERRLARAGIEAHRLPYAGGHRIEAGPIRELAERLAGTR